MGQATALGSLYFYITDELAPVSNFTFKLGEDVTHIYKTLIENKVGEGYRMYHTRRYIAF